MGTVVEGTPGCLRDGHLPKAQLASRIGTQVTPGVVERSPAEERDSRVVPCATTLTDIPMSTRRLVEDPEFAVGMPADFGVLRRHLDRSVAEVGFRALEALYVA